LDGLWQRSTRNYSNFGIATINDHEHRPTSARQAVEWAVSEGLLELPRIDPYDVLAGEMAQALRAEIQTDERGRRYRVNHAVRVTKSGVQHTFWGMLGFAPHSHMERAFFQRREQVVGDLVQLKTDIDVYNDLSQGNNPRIQLVLDFTDDVAERQQLEDSRKKTSAVKKNANEEVA
jgi:hypothetical protein